MERKVTERGFGRVDFLDMNSNKCSIQESIIFKHLY